MIAPIQPPDGRLRVAIIGAGDIAPYHLHAWQSAGVELVAVCDTVEARARERAGAFGITKVHTDAARMLAQEELDAVDIATWRDSHIALANLAIDEGVHILCQKPLAPSLAQSEALVARADGKVRLMVNENRRYAPNFARIDEWMRNEPVGPVRQVHMIMHRSGYLKNEDGVRQAVQRAPRMGDEPRLLIAETLIHQIDVLRMLLGPLRVLAARAARTEPDMPGETLASIMFETERNAPVILSGSFVAPGFGTAVSDRLELIGAHSTILLDGMALEARGAFEARETFDANAVYQACFDAAAAHFTRALMDGSPFPQTPQDNLATLRLVEDAYRAAETPAPTY